MAIDIVKFIKGILVKNETDTSKQLKFEVSASATTATTTTVQSAQTANVTITLPSATDTLVGKATTDTLTNKTFDADGTGNSISNIENADIKAGAAIDATKIADGSVSSTEFQYLGGVTSDIQTQINGVTGSAVTSLTGDVTGTGPGATATTIANGVVTDAKVATGISAAKIGAGSVDNTEFGYLDGVTSAIQTQINSKQDASTAVTLTGTQTLTNKTLQYLQQEVATDTTTTGSNTTLAAFTTGIVRITDGSLSSLSGIPAGASGQQLIIENKTGVAVTINNDDAGETAANRIFTGTGSSVSMLDNSTFIFTYDTTSSRWMLTSGSGSGSSSGINYITFGNAEADSQGWDSYTDAASPVPVDGTGSPSGVLTTTVNSPLRGSKSYFISKDNTNRQGQGASYDFTIDAADKAKVLQISFDYFVYAGTYADGDLAVYIYDVTNAQIIQPAGFSIQNAIGTMSQKATFQAASNSTSYRLIFHIASTSTATYTFQFDNVSVGPQIVTNGAAITDWVSFTPTGSWTTNASYTGRWRRIGDSMEIEANITLVGGAPGGTSLLSFDMVSGYTQDTSKFPNTNSQSVGTWHAIDTGVQDYGGELQSTGTAFYLTQGTGRVTATSPFTFGNTDVLQIRAVVPILGWSSNVQLSSDTDTRVVAANATSPSTTTTSNTNTGVVFTSTLSDTHGSFNTSTGVYTVQVPGFYDIAAYVGANAASWSAGERLIMYYRKNATDTEFGRETITATVSQVTQISGTALGVPLVAGDTIQLRLLGERAVTLFGGFISIARQSGPSTIAASETVACNYGGTIGQSCLGTYTTNVVKFQTKQFDTHGAYNTSTGNYTCPVSGKYRVSGKFILASGLNTASDYYIGIAVNGTTRSTYRHVFNANDTLGYQLETTALVQVNAGDAIQIIEFHGSSSTYALSVVGTDNSQIALERVGN